MGILGILLRRTVQIVLATVSWSVAFWIGHSFRVARTAAVRAIELAPPAEKMQRAWTKSWRIFPALSELLRLCVTNARSIGQSDAVSKLPRELRGSRKVPAQSISHVVMDSYAGSIFCQNQKAGSGWTIDSYSGGSASQLCARLKEDSAEFVLLSCHHIQLSERILRRSAGYLEVRSYVAIQFRAEAPHAIGHQFPESRDVRNHKVRLPPASKAPILLSREDLLSAINSRSFHKGESIGHPQNLSDMVLSGLARQEVQSKQISASAIDFESCPILLCDGIVLSCTQSNSQASLEHANSSLQADSFKLSTKIGAFFGASNSSGTVKGPAALVILPMSSHPVEHGNRRRAVELGSLLHEYGFKTSLAFAPSYGHSPGDTEAMEDFWGEVAMLRRLGPHAFDFERYESILNRYNADLIRELSAEKQFDVVLGIYAWIAPLVNQVIGEPHKILDAQDILANRWNGLENMGLTPSFYSLRPEQERAFVSAFDEVWAISRTEKEVLDKYETGVPVFHMPPIVHPVGVGKRRPGRTIRFGIVASDNAINTASVTDLLEAILSMPTYSGWELTIGGSVARAIPGRVCNAVRRKLGPRVRFIGPILELDSFYEGIDAAVSVARGGTGTSMKAVEAIARGRALISNDEGSRGLDSHVKSHNLASIPDVARAMNSMSAAELMELQGASVLLAKQLQAIVQSTAAASLGRWRRT